MISRLKSYAGVLIFQFVPAAQIRRLWKRHRRCFTAYEYFIVFSITQKRLSEKKKLQKIIYIQKVFKKDS